MAASGISAVSSTETKYPTLINGYLCYSAAEVQAARQMINPRTVDRVTGQPQRNDIAVTSAPLSTYTAQGAARSDDETARRGSRLDILA